MVAALKFPPLSRPQDQDTLRRGEAGPIGRIGPGAERSFLRLREANRKLTERRVFPRKDVTGRVQGKRMDHSVHAHKMPFLSLSMRDLSVGGLCGTSQEPAELGEHVAVFFPPEGALRGWDAYGRVVRCLPKGQGYEVAIEFDSLPAA